MGLAAIIVIVELLVGLDHLVLVDVGGGRAALLVLDEVQGGAEEGRVGGGVRVLLGVGEGWAHVAVGEAVGGGVGVVVAAVGGGWGVVGGVVVGVSSVA